MLVCHVPEVRQGTWQAVCVIQGSRGGALRLQVMAQAVNAVAEPKCCRIYYRTGLLLSTLQRTV